MIRKFTPRDADERARDYIALFTRRQVDSAVARLVPDLSTPNAREQIDKIAALLADQRFDSVRVIGVQVNIINSVRHVRLEYELHSRAGWFVATVATMDAEGYWMVEGIYAQRLARPLEEQTRFSLAGKSFVHYVCLLLTILCACLSLGTMVFIATRRAMPKRWRWVAASIVGVSPVDLNWATGAVGVRAFSVQFGSAAFMRAGPAAPWIITFALPLGAIIALERYRRWRVAESTAAASASLAPTRAPEEIWRERLLTPDWRAVVRKLGRPLPRILNELYSNHTLLTSTPVVITNPNSADGTMWEIATFQPADATGGGATHVGVPTNAFWFATSPSGDPYYLLIDERSDGPVYLFRQIGADTVLVAQTLQELLSWPRRSLAESPAGDAPNEQNVERD